MSLLPLNENYSSPLKPDDKNDVIFELPSISSMKSNDQTEGFLNFITSHGNTKLNAGVDNLTKEKTRYQMLLDGSIDQLSSSGIKNLLSIEDKASNTEMAEIIFAMKMLENVQEIQVDGGVDLEIKHTEEEIAKYTEIKENLTKAIHKQLS